MKNLLNILLVLALGLPPLSPTMVHAQGELSQCGKKANKSEYPCQMVGRVARDPGEWRVLNLIRNGKAKTVEEARAILERRRANKNLAECGTSAQDTPLPCKFDGKRVDTAEDWRIADLIARGRAANKAEARAILEERRARNNLPACSDSAKNTPLPCVMVGREVTTKEGWREINLIRLGRANTVAEARQILKDRRAAKEVQQCGTSAATTPLPCVMSGREVQSKEDWRIVNLIRLGRAANVREARAILEERRARNALPDCGARATNTPLPCVMGDRIVNTADDWAVARLIFAGRAANEAEARAILDERRAARNLPACGERATNTPLPCKMGEDVVRNQSEWAIARLIYSGQATTAAEARAILEERRADSALPACGPRAKDTALPCKMGNRIARSKEEWRIFDLIAQGKARNVAQAQDLLAERRAARAAQTAADEAEIRAARRAERRERRRAERAAAAAAAAAADADLESARAETVERGDLRTSADEFNGGDDGGLSKFEKALLLGLGAVVVGSVLKNGDKVLSRSGDRVVVESPEGDLRVLKDDDALIQRPGDKVQTRTYDDGSTRTMVTKPDGSRIITVRGRDGTVLRRVSIDPGGTPTVLIDDTIEEQAVEVSELPRVIDGARQVSLLQSEEELRQALASQLRASDGRRFSLRQVREITEVRALAPQIELDAIRFESGSAAIRPEQARALARIGTSLRDMIAQDPRTIILIEGHTDATGGAGYNLALSDRRAETVALAMTEYFQVPPANMITQGYGEASLKVPTLEAEAANRRAVVRNITGLLQ